MQRDKLKEIFKLCRTARHHSDRCTSLNLKSIRANDNRTHQTSILQHSAPLHDTYTDTGSRACGACEPIQSHYGTTYSHVRSPFFHFALVFLLLLESLLFIKCIFISFSSHSVLVIHSRIVGPCSEASILVVPMNDDDSDFRLKYVRRLHQNQLPARVAMQKNRRKKKDFYFFGKKAIYTVK